MKGDPTLTLNTAARTSYEEESKASSPVYKIY